ncbi:hypothetical protein ABPG75_002450 [Micractinium tetrahymenae]
MADFKLAGSASARLRSILQVLVPLVLVFAIYQSGIWRVAKTKRRATTVLGRSEQSEAVQLDDLTVEQAGGARSYGGSGSREAATTGPRVKQQELAGDQPAGPPWMSEEEAAQRCHGAKGDWCRGYFTQRPIPATPPPRGDKSCLWGCNFVGVCDHMAGWCRCPAGWDGDDCIRRRRRPCSQLPRQHGFEPFDEPLDMSKGAGNNARCAQLCDEDIGYCFCNSTWAHGHQLAPPDARPGMPPVRRGRPLGFHCQPNKDDAGNSYPGFGPNDPAELWGPEGWCTADRPKYQCPCLLDGYGGPTCEDYLESFCANQCNGHGECNMGFCECHEGWWGHDCAYRTANATDSPGMEEGARPWLKPLVHTPAAKDPEPGSSRKRPLIYIYELPAMFNQVMLQYRPDRGTCVHRMFSETNGTIWVDGWLYAAETGLHEALLQSEHRTLNPEEADYFYIPIYSSCYLYPIHGFNDSPYFHGGRTGIRVHNTINMLIEMHAWLRSHHPWWDRNGGRDHIILQTHDEGSCWLPAVLRPAVLLTHWGRTDIGHASNTGYGADNYTYEASHPVWSPEGCCKEKLGDYPCFNPEKDLVIPPMASPMKYSHSPLFGNPAKERSILGFFKGRTQQNNPMYSRGIRQKLENLCRDQDWWGKHRITLGEGMPEDLHMGYSEALASSKFCFVLPGDGWSARLEDAVLHGCVPVIIQDGVQLAFESVLDFESFAIRIPQKDMHNVPRILEAVPEDRIVEMQQALGKVWRRWIYTGYRPYGALAKQYLRDKGAGENKTVIKEAYKSYPHPENDYDPAEGDALETIFAWLHSRIPHTRGPATDAPGSGPSKQRQGKRSSRKEGSGGRR